MSDVIDVRPAAQVEPVSVEHVEPTVDRPPLWTPHDERVFRQAALSSPPSAVDGWTWGSRVMYFFLSSPRVIAARVGMIVALLSVASALPTLADYSSWGNLGRVAWYHAWTLAVLAILSTRIRAVAAHRLLGLAILGASLGAIAVYYLSGPINDLTGADTPSVWVTPPLEETVKLLLVAGVLLFARRRLAQPGVVDLGLVGYAVGAGFAFHEDALWGRVTTSGFDGPWGLAFPTIFQPDGLFVIGHAGWTAMTAIGLGMIVLHWRRPLWAVLGAVLIVVPFADHMAINSRDGAFDWVNEVLFDHKAPAWLLALGFIVALGLDLQVRRSMSGRDHVLPSGSGHRAGDDPDPTALVGRVYAMRRYARFRNGVHYARHRDRAVWPAPRPASTSAVLVNLGRSARTAGYPVGPRADTGWDLDPSDPERARWFTTDGWTPYVSSPTGVELSPAPGRAHAVGVTRDDPAPNWMKLIGLFVGVVVAAVMIRWATAPEQGPAGVRFSLPDAPNRPPNRMFPPGTSSGCGYFCGDPGDGPGNQGDDADGDPPPPGPGPSDGPGGPGGPDDSPPQDSPPEDPPPEEDCE
jgi:RsiW-degrading membrane proteinase PrsW (M82 family)